MDSKKTLKEITINEEMRKKLKEPFGFLFKDIKEITNKFDLTNKKIFVVGDISVLNLIKLGKKNIKAFCNIYDHKTKRKRISFLSKFFLPNPSCVCKNPAGKITIDLMENLDTCIKKGGNLLVKGEEDLAALYLFTKLDKAQIVLYGQPKKGIVLTFCNLKTKKRANSILHSLEDEIYEYKKE